MGEAPKVGVATILAFAFSVFVHSAALPEVSIQRQVQYFVVQADDAISLKFQLKHSSIPGVTDTDARMAAIEYQLGMHGNLRSDNDGKCLNDNVHVTLRVRIYLPLLVTDSKQLDSQWKVFLAYARQHEEAHARLAIKYAHQLEPRLAELIAKDCQTLRAKAQELLDEFDARLEREQTVLERRTNLDEYFD